LRWASVRSKPSFRLRRAAVASASGTRRPDVCLIPQIANALRVDLDLAPYPTIRAIERECAALDAFARAHPSAQPEARQ
jgi:glutathione S-transferase